MLQYRITDRRFHRRDLDGREWDALSVEWTHPDGRELHPGGPCLCCGQQVAGSTVVHDEVYVPVATPSDELHAGIEAKRLPLEASLGVA